MINLDVEIAALANELASGIARLLKADIAERVARANKIARSLVLSEIDSDLDTSTNSPARASDTRRLTASIREQSRSTTEEKLRQEDGGDDQPDRRRLVNADGCNPADNPAPDGDPVGADDHERSDARGQRVSQPDDEEEERANPPPITSSTRNRYTAIEIAAARRRLAARDVPRVDQPRPTRRVRRPVDPDRDAQGEVIALPTPTSSFEI